MTVNNHETIISAIKNHMGMGIIAAHLVEEELKNNEIISITTSDTEIINTISLVQLQDKIPTLTEKIFIDFFVKQISYT